MEIKVTTSVIKIQNNYYKQIGSTKYALRWAGIFSKSNI